LFSSVLSAWWLFGYHKTNKLHTTINAILCFVSIYTELVYLAPNYLVITNISIVHQHSVKINVRFITFRFAYWVPWM